MTNTNTNLCPHCEEAVINETDKYCPLCRNRVNNPGGIQGMERMQMQHNTTVKTITPEFQIGERVNIVVNRGSGDLQKFVGKVRKLTSTHIGCSLYGAYQNGETVELFAKHSKCVKVFAQQ